MAGALSGSARAIEDEWERHLKQAGFETPDNIALSRLNLHMHAHTLAEGNLQKFEAAMERSGRTLAVERVPEPSAIAVMTLYADCAIPFLEDAASQRALLKVLLAGQFFVHSGYAERKAETWRSVDDRERRRLSRDLHDDLGHNLLVLKLYVETVAIDLKDNRIGQAGEKLDEMTALVKRSVETIRRLILDLGPAGIEEMGFKAALKLYARQFSRRTGIAAHLVIGDLPPKLPTEYEATIYRTIQGALSNVLAHSGASAVTITLGSVRHRALVLTIDDNGRGFDTARPLGFGLRAIRERIEILGGRFHLTSRPAKWFRENPGTRIEIDLPVELQ